MKAQAAYRARDGVQIAPPRQRYELRMRDRAGHDVRAVSSNFDALLEFREQLARLGCQFVRLQESS